MTAMPDGRERAFRAWLVFVLTAGAVLRVAGLWAPLTHDELSAIVRLQADSFAGLLLDGVWPDGHPAGMQVLLWFWSRLVGTSAPLLRLPFTLLSLATLPLLYSIGSRWYGRMAGLAATTVLAFSQYAVYYAMPVRPYGAGLFFVLLATHFWTLICVEHRGKWGYAAGFALSAAACAYMHYFCALTAALLAIAGLFVVDRSERRYYLGACLAAVLLFMPHIGITRHHLFDLKGVGGWVAKPGPQFLWRYLRYMTHFSWTTLGVLVVAWVAMADPSVVRGRWRLMTVAVTIFALPLTAGYVYSRLVDPVLQYSVLIFSWPFLVLVAAGLVGERYPRRVGLATAACAVAMLTTLFVERRHYEVIGSEYIDKAATMAGEARSRYGAERVELVLGISPEMLEYYDKSLADDVRRAGLTQNTGFSSQQSGCDYAVVAKVYDDVLAAKMRQYPYVVEAHMGAGTPVMLLSRHAADGSVYPERVLKEGVARVDGEYTFLLDTAAGDIAATRHFVINSMVVGGDSTMLLVMETWVGKRCVDWRSQAMGDTVYLPLCQNLNIKSRAELRRSRIKVFVQSTAGHAADAVPFRIVTAAGDELIYAVTEEI